MFLILKKIAEKWIFNYEDDITAELRLIKEYENSKGSIHR
jgi:hypothetical protein